VSEVAEPALDGDVARPAAASRRERLRRRAGATRAWMADLIAHRATAPFALVILTAYSIYSRVYALNAPCGHPCRPPGGAGLIFDEKYYVNAARVILGWHVPAGSPYAAAPAGSDPNSEHPPLAKLMMAGSMRLFGDNPWGWRFGSIVAGTVALLAMYALVRALRGSRWLALGAAAVMALDNLAMVHGRIGTLDIYALAFALLAATLYLRGHPLVAGALLGVGICTKFIAAYLVLVLLLFELARLLGRKRIDPAEVRSGMAPTLRAAFARQLWFLVVAAVVYLGLLSGLDALVRPYDPNDHVYLSNAFTHTWHMLQFASQQRSPHGPTGIASYPWDWFINHKSIDYYTVTTTVTAGGEVVSRHQVLSFRGEMNPFLIFIAIPALVLAGQRWWRDRRDLDLLALAWVVGTFLPLLAQSLFDQRTSYLYYMLIVLPGIYLAAVRLFSSRGFPRAATVGWAVTLVIGFAALYPIRTTNW
jgi:4-amino-4-deoxy-L-arabinose transferase-like glycosyltransferase